MNTHAKGSRVRLACRKVFESNGYFVDIGEKQGKFIKDKDLLHVADLIAIKKGEVIFIQVTCNVPHTHKVYQKFVDDYCCNNIRFEQWVWMDSKGWKIFKYYENKKHEVSINYGKKS